MKEDRYRFHPYIEHSPRQPNTSDDAYSFRAQDSRGSGINPEYISYALRVGLDVPGLEWFVPQKREIEIDVLSLPLTRPQRSIYMLIDGRRTIADLSRCTRKSTQEVGRLLCELQERNLILL